MKAALITPIPMLQTLAFGDMHLLLDNLAQESPAYRSYYRKRAAQGDYLILDNSAHEEGAGNDHVGLLTRARQVYASELVCPDVLFDAMGTVDRTAGALAYYKDQNMLGLQLMLVPQAALEPFNKGEEWAKCLYMLCEMHSQTFPGKTFTVGISKDYEVWPGGIDALITRYVKPLLDQRKYDFEVHLLGWGRDSARLYDLGRNHTWIRSTDSAKPYVYASQHTSIPYPTYAYTTADPRAIFPPYPGRPDGFFNMEFDQSQIAIAINNALAFHAWARYPWLHTLQRKAQVTT